MTSTDWTSLALNVALPLSLGFASALVTRNGTQSPWYLSLKKPEWQPPPWVFGPVWTILYILTGLASWQVSTVAGGTDATLKVLYALQLALNAAWSPAFFTAKSLTLSLGIMGLLLAAVGATTYQFHQVDRMAGYLMFPYLAWLGFAGALNLDLYLRNPKVD